VPILPCAGLRRWGATRLTANHRAALHSGPAFVCAGLVCVVRPPPVPNLSAQGAGARRVLGLRPPRSPSGAPAKLAIPTTDRLATSGQRWTGLHGDQGLPRGGSRLGEFTWESRPRRRARIQRPPPRLEHLSYQLRASSCERTLTSEELLTRCDIQALVPSMGSRLDRGSCVSLRPVGCRPPHGKTGTVRVIIEADTSAP
jgi:hypothetical protein